MTANEIPEGFARHFRKSRVTDPWEPLYSRRVGDAIQIGLHVEEAHCNSRGLLHGGVIAALADNAMGLSCVAALGEKAQRGLVTVGLTIDYVGAARLGQWLQVEPRVVKAGTSLAFADALVMAGGGVIARASASFKI